MPKERKGLQRVKEKKKNSEKRKGEREIKELDSATQEMAIVFIFLKIVRGRRARNGREIDR